MERRITQIIFVALSVIGIILIFNAFNWGNEAAVTFLQQSGGANSLVIELVYNEKIVAYRWIGSILLFQGLLGLVLTSIIGAKG